MLQLHDNPFSPFCRKVQVLLHESGQKDDVEILYAVGTALAPEKMPTAHNPLGKIPTLVRDDGPAIYDSRVICQYLNDRFQGGLYPQDTRKWETLTLEATADGIMDSAVSMAYEVRLRPQAQQSQDWIEAQWAKVSRAIGSLNERWISHLSGPLDMGQIGIACALGYVDFRHGARNWRDGNDALAKWYAEFDSRPSMQATRPPAA